MLRPVVAAEGDDALRIVNGDLAAAGTDDLVRRAGGNECPAGALIALPVLVAVDGLAVRADGAVFVVLVGMYGSSESSTVARGSVKCGF